MEYTLSDRKSRDSNCPCHLLTRLFIRLYITCYLYTLNFNYLNSIFIPASSRQSHARMTLATAARVKYPRSLLCIQAMMPRILLQVISLSKQHHNIVASCHKFAHCLGFKRCMLQQGQIVKLFADHIHIIAFRMVHNILYQWMICI